MARWLATKTLAAIDEAICSDGGNAFRKRQGEVLPHISDAYREDDDSYRTHLGASVIGGKCARAVAYGFRWALRKKPRGKKNEPAKKAESRMRRLWNRGHLEEGRFISLLLIAGIAVYQQDAEGKQFRIMNYGGHFSGSGDGILLGIPDLPDGVPALGEFKTHGDKSFEELKDSGVREAKPEHYVQMQEYMHHFGLMYAFYMAVNKNTEELYAEIVTYDRAVSEHYLERAKSIIFDTELPKKIAGASPGFFHCKYMCDYTDVCFSTVKPDRNCRTCAYGFAMPDGTWQCAKTTETLDKEAQLRGCGQYRLDSALK